jgi:hypothetical protein
MDTVKKTIKEIRRQGKNTTKESTPWDMTLAELRVQLENRKRWELDKKINRDHAFEKAKIKLAEYRAAQQAEKERQEEINSARLRNLKKARRTLARMREGE